MNRALATKKSACIKMPKRTKVTQGYSLLLVLRYSLVLDLPYAAEESVKEYWLESTKLLKML